MEDIFSSDLDVKYEAMENTDLDMPEDLSAKYKSVSVQTENCHQDKFKQLFEGFSQNQIGSLMHLLIQFLTKKDDERAYDHNLIRTDKEVI